MIIKIDHEKNGRFYKQPFISEIDDVNQTITFFVVLDIIIKLTWLKEKFKL